MRTAVLGAALLAAGLVMALLLVWTDLDVATVIVAGFIAAFLVLSGFAVACVITGTAGRRNAEVGDDAIAIVAEPSDAEIEQMIRNYPKGGGRG